MSGAGARGVVGDDAQALQVAQETCLRVLHSFGGESALATWLARIAIHAASLRQ